VLIVLTLWCLTGVIGFACAARLREGFGFADLALAGALGPFSALIALLAAETDAGAFEPGPDGG
jgi:hypothetical protein